MIDDDEAMVVTTERQHYQATQDAFPRLLTSESETPSSSGTSSTLSPDLHLVESVHAIAERERLQQLEQERHLELARQQMLHQSFATSFATSRRTTKRTRAFTVPGRNPIVGQTTARRRNSSRASRNWGFWREEQREKLRLLSEEKTQAEKKREQAEKEKMEAKKMDTETHGGDNNTATQEVADGPSEEEMAVAKNKTKALENKRRQKERKKAQMQEEQALLDKKEKEQELAAKKAAAAAVQCAACGQGVLGCGFEKFQQSQMRTDCQTNRIL